MEPVVQQIEGSVFSHCYSKTNWVAVIHFASINSHFVFSLNLKLGSFEWGSGSKVTGLNLTQSIFHAMDWIYDI